MKYILLKNKSFYLLFVASLLPIASFADENEARLGVGVNYSVDFQSYHGNDQIYNALPVFFYDNNKVYIEGNEAGVYLLKDSKNELRLNAYYDGNTFDPSGRVKDLNKRDWSVMAGGSYMRITPYGGIKAQVGTDVLSRSKGTVATLSYVAALDTGKWSIYPELGLQWNDAKYNQYYFGVSKAEAERSHLPEFTPHNSIHPYASLNVNYKVNKHWNAFAGLDVAFLSDEQRESPMTDRRLDIEPSIGFMYRF